MLEVLAIQETMGQLGQVGLAVQVGRVVMVAPQGTLEMQAILDLAEVAVVAAVDVPR